MALLALAHALLGGGVAVATVDHGLRPEAAAECALVAEVCEQRAIPCRILSVEVEKGNVLDRARAARYAALGAWAESQGLAAIATAHHADDQTETLIMRLNRGSGLAGLAGIRSSTMMEGCPVPMVRPLLGFRKSELRNLLERAGVPFAEDPSNRDASYERVRIRRHLERADWIDSLAVSRSAAHLEQAECALDAVTLELWESRASVGAARVAVPASDSPEITRRLLGMAVASLGGMATQGQIAAFLDSGDRRANVAGVLIERQAEGYVCTPEPPRRGEARQIR